ncbi:hypothetical protein PFISCL1PPCAC_4673 [Pristionchus fissidentatus]|uniref:Membrane transporter n=1 Tax=Pristionchus fissidentatus TaxID=1538716 RepID=A0AAV5V216_9BILA|nr:hypothetical protein PFISCL1PPCAC_4673 [Pristionchus fissidentatus]
MELPSPESNNEKTSRLNEGKEENEEPPTQWRLIIICATIYFLITTVLTTLNVVAYLYLKNIDPSISPVYAGLHLASAKFGHAIGTVAFAVYAYSYKCFTKPLLIGRVISIFSIILYLGILMFPESSRRYVFLISFLMQSFAEGSLIVMRSYIPRVSTEKDRHAAYGIISGAVMMSILAGPGIQMSADFLPVVELYSRLELRGFTYPIWIALFLCVLAMFLISNKLEDPTPMEEEKKLTHGSFVTSMATAIEQVSLVDKAVLGMIFFERIICSVAFSALLAVFAPYIQTTFNSDNSVIYTAGAQGVAGIVSMLTVAFFIFSPILKSGRCSLLLFFSLSCYFFMYLYSFPWSPISEPITVMSTENPHGCNTTELAWCVVQSHVKMWYWLPVIVFLFAMAVPTSMISIDTVYSKLLGDIDQNIMQGALVLVDDIASSVAPIVTMKIYTSYGLDALWLALAGAALVGFFAWILMIPKMRKLKL